MKALHNTYEVVIIGGGPAGSAMGIYLAQHGIQTLLLEKEHFPRPHVGESLLPFCYEIFEELGVLEELKETMVRKPGVRFYNADGSSETTYCFKNLLDGPNYLSFHVLRSRFDKILLDRAKECGVEVLEGSRVNRVDLEGSLATLRFSNEESTQEITAKFVVDATGQDTFLASKLKVKRKHPDLDRVGMVGHFKNYSTTPGIDEGLLQLAYTSGEKKGWCAIVPVGKNHLSLGLVVDFAYMRKQKQNYANSSDWKLDFYMEELHKIPIVNSILQGAEQTLALQTVGNYSYKVDQRFGANFAIVGDAAGFIDPIFATGVYLALNASRTVAPAVIEAIKGQPQKAQFALKASYTGYMGAIELVEKFIRNFYDPEFINLAEVQSMMKGTDDDHTPHEIAFSMLHFLMGGDFFKEYERYSNFVDFLKQPNQLERYMHLVINNKQHTDATCGMLFDEIFPKNG